MLTCAAVCCRMLPYAAVCSSVCALGFSTDNLTHTLMHFFLFVFLFFSLACAHSNAATDNLMQKLIHGNQLSVVRIGRPGTVAPALRAHCLEALIGMLTYA